MKKIHLCSLLKIPCCSCSDVSHMMTSIFFMDHHQSWNEVYVPKLSLFGPFSRTFTKMWFSWSKFDQCCSSRAISFTLSANFFHGSSSLCKWGFSSRAYIIWTIRRCSIWYPIDQFCKKINFRPWEVQNLTKSMGVIK